MKISSLVSNTRTEHKVEVETNGRHQKLDIAPKNVGRGSSINGGDLLLTALATCFCNDLYREAERLNIDVEDVRVEARAIFGAPATRF
jgi:uncharacterized OsmC-like protein